MSTHDEITGLLDDFVGGELDERGRRAVQLHLDECHDCRAEVDTLRALLDEARFLPRTLAPSRDLWAGIETRLEPKGGAAVIEIVFGRPGLGKTLVDAILSRDYPLSQAMIIVFLLAVVFVNLITDCLYGLVDPRISHT